MAIIKINTSAEEQHQVLEALKHYKGKTVPVTQIEDRAGINKNRVRYILVDLIDSEKIKKVPTKSFNEHYNRYRYDICE